MDSEQPNIQSRFAELSLRLTAIERRLEVLEGGRAPVPPVAQTAEPPAVRSERTEGSGRPISELLPIIGRTVLIIGGAFVLRAITEAGLLGLGAGAAAGIVYALVWIVLAHRMASGGRRLNATFFGIAS